MPLAYLPKDLANPYPTGLSDEEQGLLHRKKMTRFLFENRPAMWGPSPTLYLDFDKKEKDAYVRIEQGMLAEIAAKIAEARENGSIDRMLAVGAHALIMFEAGQKAMKVDNGEAFNWAV